jgi:hypothetical protein
MRQLQFHEYLALLDGGTQPERASDALTKACLEDAKSIWPQLSLGGWTKRPRKVEYVAKCQGNGKRLVHVSADWENCFLILVVPLRKRRAESYLLFDIGAEYTLAKFICPPFDLEQTADRDTIRKFVPRLQGERDPFAILESGKGTYMQAYAEDGLFDVEHQMVSLSFHYCLDERVDADTVVRLFLSYAFGKKEWAHDFTWNKMKL